jgi:2-polyprenyl-3-methyl-5-hydroxy-6-metoxy-1,4-benzoquinol methylase
MGQTEIADSNATEQKIASNSPLCAFCGGITVAHYSNCADRVLSATPGAYDYRRCDGCGSLHIDPMPSAEILRIAYSGDYMTHSAAPIQESSSGHQSFQASLRDAMLGTGYGYRRLSDSLPAWLRLIGATASWLPAMRSRAGCHVRFLKARDQGRLLDVGCGNGQFLASARKLGWTGTGLEPDPVAADLARKRGCQVIENNIEAFSPGQGEYHAITMDHVLEHVADPQVVLAKLRAALTDDGVLVTFTPNPGSLVAKCFGISWYGLDPPRHLHIPTARGLRELFEEAGFHPTVFAVPRISNCYAQESMSIRRSGRAHGAQSRFIRNVFGMAAQLCGLAGLRSGDELVCVATKRSAMRDSL